MLQVGVNTIVYIRNYWVAMCLDGILTLLFLQIPCHYQSTYLDTHCPLVLNYLVGMLQRNVTCLYHILIIFSFAFRKRRGAPIDTNKRLRGCKPFTVMSNTTCAHAPELLSVNR